MLYGEEEEVLMAESPDPVIRRIWEEKEVTKYSVVVSSLLTNAYDYFILKAYQVIEVK